MKFYNGKKVVGLYHRGHKVLYQYHRGRLVYSGEDPYAYGGYIKEGLVLQLDCRRKPVESKEDPELYEVENLATNKSLLCAYMPDLDIAEIGHNVSLDGDYTIEFSGKYSMYDDKSVIGHMFMTNNALFGGIMMYGGGASLPVSSFSQDEESTDFILPHTKSTEEGFETSLTIGDLVTMTVVKEGGSIRYYVDGVLANEDNCLISHYSQGLVLRKNAVFYYFVDGSLRVYKRVLTPKQIAHNRQKDVENFTKTDIPQGAFVDANGKVLVDSEGRYLTFNN